MDVVKNAAKLRLDPKTFEILRHRLWYLNDEGALTISRTSGSPVATEVFDMNAGLLTAEGELVYIDNFICAQATTIAPHVQHLLAEYEDNPGFQPGDIFLCNDPYVSVCHQNCVQVVGPIFWEGELAAWAGASLHVIDIGGPVAGQVQLGAADIFGEQPITGPIKVVEAGAIRKDIENTYLRNSRLPELLALDLRAKIAAVRVIDKRMQETFEEFGFKTVQAAMRDIIDYTEHRLRERIQELPDGIWRHRGYIEFGDEIFKCHVLMKKEGDRLIFDFSETDDQAPAVINCTYNGLMGGVLAAVMVYLCWDIPWSPAGVARCIEIRSRPGSLFHSTWPAGVSKSTTTSIWEVRNLASITLGKLLGASEEYRDRAMAGWQGVKALEELFGTTESGERFGGPLLDGMAGGGGALCYRDGIDTGGHTSSIRATIANVESYEHRYPILYLYRKQTPDSGGAGKFRGGAGVSMMYTLNGVEEIPTKILHTFGIEQPESPGMFGGYPSTTNQFAIVRDSNLEDRFEKGQVPQDLEALEGELETYGTQAVTSMERGDVYRAVSMGGGGYGDPIERDPARVAQDVENGLVSREWAERIYGVVLVEGQLEVDGPATEARREEIRGERKQAAGDISQGSNERPTVQEWSPAATAVRLSESIFYDEVDDELFYRCRCGAYLGDIGRGYKATMAVARFPVQRIGPEVNPYQVGGGRFEVREFYCPECYTRHEIEIGRPDDPLVDDAQLDPNWVRSHLER